MSTAHNKWGDMNDDAAVVVVAVVVVINTVY
jgi:hypothetical protein